MEAADWVLAIGVALLVLAPAFLKWFVIELVPWLIRTLGVLLERALRWVLSWVPEQAKEYMPARFGSGSDSVMNFPLLSGLSASDPTLTFAFIVASFCLGLATIIVLFALPIYIFSADPKRSKKAGVATRMCLTFILTSGGGVMAYLGFKA